MNELTDQRPRPNLPALTSIRFFAAAYVVAFHMHALNIRPISASLDWIALSGYLGVTLFFVLSGFILVYTYAGRRVIPLEFLRARAARIYPLYLFALLVNAPAFFYLVFTLDLPFYAWVERHLVLSCALVTLMLQSWVPGAALALNGPAWSVSVEAFFYLLFPFLLASFVSCRRVVLLACMGAFWLLSVSVTGAYVVLQPDAPSLVGDTSLAPWLSAVKFNPLARLPEFLIGMCTGILFLQGSLTKRSAALLVAGGGLTFMLAVSLSPAVPYPLLHNGLLAPCAAAVIYGLALQPTWSKWLEHPALVRLGEASYALYLLHTAFLGWYFLPTGSVRPFGPIDFTLGMALLMVVSLLAHRYIEQPARRRLRPTHQLAEPRSVQAARVLG